MAIILHSGAYERVSNALALARVGLAIGCQVQVFVTFDALRRFTRGRLGQVDDDTPPDLRERIERGLASGGIQPLEQELADARRLGLKLYACPKAMVTMDITRGDLADEIDGVMGLATFLTFALGAAATWYI